METRYKNKAWVRRCIKDAVLYLHDHPKKRPARSARKYLGNWLRREVRDFGNEPDPVDDAPSPEPVDRPKGDEALQSQILEALSRSIKDTVLDMWFGPMRVVRAEDRRITLSWPNEAFVQWVRTQWNGDVERACARAGYPRVIYTIDSSRTTIDGRV